MNSRCMSQVKVPTLMWVNWRLRTVGGQEGGATPRLDLMERPTPMAIKTSPAVEMP